jgi:hypothetical protein
MPSTIFPIWHNGESYLSEANDESTPRNMLWLDGESNCKLNGWQGKICGIKPGKIAGAEQVSIGQVGGVY